MSAPRNELKTWPAYFHHIWDGRKTFELRRDDRGFAKGDKFTLREWENRAGIDDYSGREIDIRISYVMRGATLGNERPIKPGFCIFSFEVLEKRT